MLDVAFLLQVKFFPPYEDVPAVHVQPQVNATPHDIHSLEVRKEPTLRRFHAKDQRLAARELHWFDFLDLLTHLLIQCDFRTSMIK